MSLRTVLHLLAALHFWFGCYYDWYYVKFPSTVHPMGSSFGKFGKLKFLTYWDALLQGFFFTICFLNDIVGTNEPHPKKTPAIRRFKDILLASLAFPVSMFVGITFWGLYFVDRELVLPRVLDAYFPTWLNHLMHTNIMIFILIELATSFRKYPTRKLGISILITVKLCYLVWLHVIHAYTNAWVYPVLDVLNLPGRIVFFVALLGLSLLLYVLGERLNQIVWKKQLNAVKGRQGKRL